MSKGKPKAIVQGALVQRSPCGATDDPLSAVERWELRFQIELVESKHLSLRVWHKHGLKDLHRAYVDFGVR